MPLLLLDRGEFLAEFLTSGGAGSVALRLERLPVRLSIPESIFWFCPSGAV